MVTAIGVVGPLCLEETGGVGLSSLSMYSDVGETAGVNGSSELPRLEDSPNVFVLDGLDGNMESVPELVGKLEGNEGVAWNIDTRMELMGSAWAVVSELIMGAEPCFSVSYLPLQNH